MKSFLFFICICATCQLLIAQPHIRFGKKQQYIATHQEKETPLSKTIAAAYSRIYEDTLEVPLNRCFSNDTMMVFVGIPFKYSFTDMYKIIQSTGKNMWSEMDKERRIFYAQNEYNKLVINRYAYYSKSDNLLYLINYVFATNQKISLSAFKQIVLTTISKK